MAESTQSELRLLLPFKAARGFAILGFRSILSRAVSDCR